MPKFLEVSDAVAARSAINAAGGNTVYVEDYRDGVRTDNEIIAAAFADLEAGGEIRFGQGVTYTTTANILVYLADRPNVLISGQGATIQSDTAPNILFLAGTKYASTTTLTSAITSRTVTLTVADTATLGWAAGDIVSIRSDEPYAGPLQYNPIKQELGRVSSVPDSTTIVLEARTWNTYSITGYTVTLTRYRPMRNVTIRDLNIAGAGDGVTSQTGLNPRYFDGLTIDNCTVSGSALTGIDPVGGIDVTVIGCRAEGSNLSGQGYGFHAQECHGVKWIGCYGIGNRHSIDAHESRDILIQGCTAENDDASGLSTHSTNDLIKIVDCTVRECGGGIISRSPNVIIRGNHVMGTRRNEESNSQSNRNGITVSDGAQNVVIDGNYIDISGPDFSGTVGDTTQLTHGLSFQSPVINAQITNNRIKGFPTHGIYMYGDTHTGVEISGNYIDCSAQVSGTAKTGIYIRPADTDAANVQTDISIERNVLPNGAGYAGIYIQGGSTTDPRSDHIRVRDNRIGACGTTPIHLENGYFGSDVVISGNETEDTAAGLITTSVYTVPPYLGNHGYGRPARPLGIGQEMGARLRPGWSYGPAGPVSTAALTLNRLTVVPFFVSRRITTSALRVNVTSASGTGGSEGLLGIYHDIEDGYGGYPGQLVDSSSVAVATDSTGLKTGSVAVTLNPGLYWLGFVPQTATCSVTVLTGCNNQVVGRSVAGAAGRPAYVEDSVSGALPSTFTSTYNAAGSGAWVELTVGATSVLE